MILLVQRSREPRWATPAAVALALLLTVALTALPIRLAGANPAAAFQRYLVTPLTSTGGILEVLLAATPLLFTGIAVALGEGNRDHFHPRRLLSLRAELVCGF